MADKKKVFFLSQSQMDKLASCHAITELVNWISLMEKLIEEDGENLKGAVGSKVIQEYLQRYKVGLAYDRMRSAQIYQLTVINLDIHWMPCCHLPEAFSVVCAIMVLYLHYCHYKCRSYCS